jgi:hypothetical protein
MITSFFIRLVIAAIVAVFCFACDVLAQIPSCYEVAIIPEEPEFATAAEVIPAKPPRFNFATTFSWYHSPGHITRGDTTFIVTDFDSLAPASFTATHNFNLQLSMGLNLYKDINAYFDIGIDDQIMKRVVDLAGRIGTGHFSLQADYNFLGGTVSFWDNPNIGTQKDTPPDLVKDYRQIWTSVALLLRRPLLIGYAEDGTLELQIGFVWSSATIPALIWVNRDLEGGDEAFVFFDDNFRVNTYGARFIMAYDYVSSLFFDMVMDFGYGSGNPTASVREQVKEKGEGDSYDAFLIKGRMLGGWKFNKKLADNRVFSYAFGVDMYGTLYTPASGTEWETIINRGFGPFIRLGLAF